MKNYNITDIKALLDNSKSALIVVPTMSVDSIGSALALALALKSNIGILKVAAGLLESDGGERWMQPGTTIRYLPQEPGFHRHFTAFEFVDYVAILKQMTDRKQRHDEVLPDVVHVAFHGADGHAPGPGGRRPGQPARVPGPVGLHRRLPHGGRHLRPRLRRHQQREVPPLGRRAIGRLARIAALAATAAHGGCSIIPTSGPSSAYVMSGQLDPESLPYSLVKLTPEVVAILDRNSARIRP